MHWASVTKSILKIPSVLLMNLPNYLDQNSCLDHHLIMMSVSPPGAWSGGQETPESWLLWLDTDMFVVCGHPDYKTYSHGSLLESQSSPTQGAETRYDTWYIKFNHGLGTVIFHDLLQKRDLLCPENISLKSLLQKDRYMYLFIYCLERQVIY